MLILNIKVTKIQELLTEIQILKLFRDEHTLLAIKYSLKIEFNV